jgi:hypothetical protein
VKRGFNKAACKRLAAEVHTEIGLQPMDALDPWKLAKEYSAEVIPLSSLPLSSEIREHFTIRRQDLFSGALVPLGNGAVIVENDSHPPARRRSTSSPTSSESTSSERASSTSADAAWRTRYKRPRRPRSAVSSSFRSRQPSSSPAGRRRMRRSPFSSA